MADAREGAAFCERLRQLPVAIVSDVLAAMGFPDQVLASEMRPIDPNVRIAGPALCLKGVEGPDMAFPAAATKPVYETDPCISAGCIAVIATGGHRTGAVVGGNIGISWRLRGCAGIITDGGIRDAREFLEMGLAVFAAFLTPLSNKGRWSFTEIDIPITLPGQAGKPVGIEPGDLMHGDRDGVVVIPRAHLAAAVAAAETLDKIEERLRQEIGSGEDREAVYARHDRFGHIRRVV